MKKIILNIGDIYVSREPVVLQTILGSCVAVCLMDEKSGIGGMNHFMLPRFIKDVKHPSYCAPDSILLLVNNMVRAGSEVRFLKAKLFGGGKVVKKFTELLDVGKDNVRAAKEILGLCGIPVIREFTGADSGLKLVFYTATGRVFVKKLEELPEDDLPEHIISF